MKNILYIDEENFKLVDPSLLIEPNIYAQVESMVISITAAQTPEYSKEYAILLSEKLAALGNKINLSLLGKYIKLLKVLQLSALVLLSDKEKETYFKTKILELFYIDYVDVKLEIEKCFRSYFDSREIIEQWRRDFVQGLEKNSEILGKESIKVSSSGEDKAANPILQNWIIDYNSRAHVNPEIKKRGGYEQVNYMTHSPNALKLEKKDREALLKIIQLYDWLKFDPLSYDFRLPGQPEWQDEIKEIEKPEQIIPDEIALIIEKRRKEEEKTQDSTPEKPSYISREKFELPESIKRSAPTVPLPKAPAPIAPKSSPALPAFKPLQDVRSRSVNIQDILSRSESAGQHGGLRISNTEDENKISNNPVSSATQTPLVKRGGDAADKAIRQEDIDKKLEELKKRAGKK